MKNKTKVETVKGFEWTSFVYFVKGKVVSKDIYDKYIKKNAKSSNKTTSGT